MPLVFQREAQALQPLVHSGMARAFLAAVVNLPPIAPRKLYHNADKTRYFSEAQAQALPASERATLSPRDIDETFFYTTRYGTPLAYTRPLEILNQPEDALAGKRILDFGFGTIGHLRIWASMGADVTGIEVDPLLAALYSEAGDTGTITAKDGKQGRLQLLFGSFPADAQLRAQAGRDYDLIISKNVLKRGYIHPEQPVAEKMQIKLGVTDPEFLATIYSMLKPGGRFFIYNLTPAPNGPGKPYRTWADGRSPFPKGMLEQAGFRVVVFEQDDTEAARAMARALGWDKDKDEPMDVENDLFGQYTLCERPVKR